MAKGEMKGSVGQQFDLKRIIREYMRLFMLEASFALPGRVEAVHPGTQTVDVRPTLMKRYPVTGKNAPRALLVNVPFQFPRGGDSYVTLPIKAGDEGLIVFSGRDIRAWKELGGTQPLRSGRILDYNDALFLPGISAIPNAVSGYDPDNITIVKNGKKITVKDGTLEAPEYDFICKNITASGNVTVGQAVLATGAVSSATAIGVVGGPDLGSHVHSGVQRGNSTTDAPVK